MMRFLLTSFLASLFSISTLLAHTVTGKIVDQNNAPLKDVFLFVKGKNVNTISNDYGVFRLDPVAIGDTIIVSHLGFAYQEVVFENPNQPLQIQLTGTAIELSQIVVTPNSEAISRVVRADLKLNPVNSSQEILRRVPGLFVAQHAGGGKAEQFFLRGFDIDHGTDIQLTVDGLPVNMVSHAHGQGYADLHFVIPETIDKINFAKGPYYADKGNFTTAGFADLQTFNKLPQSKVILEAGRFNTLRAVGLFDLLGSTENHSAYIAAEYFVNDGPFDSPQNLFRNNIFAKYSGQLSPNDFLTFQASHLDSKWDASGQVPFRAIESGDITRFGAIDDTEGGATSRQNISLKHLRYLENGASLENQVFYSKYDFLLFSNFTFFLNDPINGDQVKQQESRKIFGWNSTYQQTLHIGKQHIHQRVGFGLRNDVIEDLELSRTVRRFTTISTPVLADINETNLYAFTDFEVEMGDFQVTAGLRADNFYYEVVNKLDPNYNKQTVSQTIVLPKFNILYTPSQNLQLFFKSGKGFHSNSANVAVARNGRQVLPAAWGADLGTIWKPANNLIITPALWYLYLDQEFVFVGDEGVVEPSGRSRRTGVDLSIRYQINKWLFADADLNYANPRSIDEARGEDYIPLAPDFTSTGGLSFQFPSGISGSLRYRHIADRAANEDRSTIARGYFITDLALSYTKKNFEVGFNIENLFDQEWEETQFDTESQLQGEASSMSEIHFTPGTPFFFKTRIAFTF